MKLLSLCKRLSATTALALVLVLTTAPMVQAAKLKKQNLTQLIASSQSIVAGTVVDLTDGVDANGVPYTEVTIEVGSVAKGDLKPGKFTFRQFGLLNPRTLPNGHRLLAMSPEGFPTWRANEYVVAFMYHPAARTGLQTTAGMAQGKLALHGDNLLSNEFGNDGLFEGVTLPTGELSAEQNAMLSGNGPVKADAFIDLVSKAVQGRWIEQGVMK